MEMRHYDAAIACWIVVDPITHHDFSPYQAFDNNPVFWADPSGADSMDSQTDIFGRNRYDENGLYIRPGERGEKSNNNEETPFQRLIREKISLIAVTANTASDGKMAEEASDSEVDAYQLFYQWVFGTGPDQRFFDENSVMGKQMLKTPEVLDAIDKAINEAVCNNNCSNMIPFFRSLKRENPIEYALFDFPKDIKGKNSCERFSWKFCRFHIGK